jgi:hypothetical protein
MFILISTQYKYYNTTETKDLDDSDDIIIEGNSNKLPENNKNSFNRNKVITPKGQDSEINFLQIKSKLKSNSNLNSKNNLKNNNTNQKSTNDAASTQEIDEESPQAKFQPYSKIPQQIVLSKEYQDKLGQFKENVKHFLQSKKTFTVGPTEGTIEKFNKRKYVEPGEDLFLGFLKYMSNTAEQVQQKIEKDKRNTDPTKFQ